MSKIPYPMCKSAIKPVPHDPDLPVRQPPTEKEDTLSDDEYASTGIESEEDLIESDPSFQHESAPLLINQERLNDLVRDLYIQKESRSVGVQAPTVESTGTRNNHSSLHSCNENLACYYASAENIIAKT